MNIDKMVEIGLLFEQYKELLTDKQKEIVSLYYEENYSLGEISENLNVSNNQEKILKSLEDKIVDIKQDLLQNRDCANLIPKLETIEQICRELLK